MSESSVTANPQGGGGSAQGLTVPTVSMTGQTPFPGPPSTSLSAPRAAMFLRSLLGMSESSCSKMLEPSAMFLACGSTNSMQIRVRQRPSKHTLAICYFQRSFRSKASSSCPSSLAGHADGCRADWLIGTKCNFWVVALHVQGFRFPCSTDAQSLCTDDACSQILVQLTPPSTNRRSAPSATGGASKANAVVSPKY